MSLSRQRSRRLPLSSGPALGARALRRPRRHPDRALRRRCRTSAYADTQPSVVAAAAIALLGAMSRSARSRWRRSDHTRGGRRGDRSCLRMRSSRWSRPARSEWRIPTLRGGHRCDHVTLVDAEWARWSLRRRKIGLSPSQKSPVNQALSPLSDSNRRPLPYHGRGQQPRITSSKQAFLSISASRLVARPPWMTRGFLPIWPQIPTSVASGPITGHDSG